MDEIDKGRRKFIEKTIGGTIKVGALAGFFHSLGSLFIDDFNKRFMAVFEGREYIPGGDELRKILLGDGNHNTRVFAGEGNVIGAANGQKGISTFLANSLKQYHALFDTAGYDIEVVQSNESPEFQYNSQDSTIFLGGPPANKISAQLLGYRDKHVEHDGKTFIIPEVDRDRFLFRYAQSHGVEGFGVYDGKKELALRYDKGEEVERAVYKIYDTASDIFLPTHIDSKGFLEREWLQVNRFIDNGSYKVVIGGMHGYSSEAFSRNLARNIDKVMSLSRGEEQFQLLIAVDLTHKKNRAGEYETIGEIDWETKGNVHFSRGRNS